MTTKTRLTRASREAIQTYGINHIHNSFDRTAEKAQLSIMVEEANAAIRTKYPEEDMVVLRKYDLTRQDNCLKFQFPSSRVDGHYFAAEDGIVDMPHARGCHYSANDVFVVNDRFEAAFDERQRLKKQNDQAVSKLGSEFLGYLAACKTVEEIQEVISLPDALLQQIGKGCTALAAVTPDTVKSLKAAFAVAA